MSRAVVQSPGAPLPDGFLVHLDADVPGPRAMPALDSPDDGGLFPAELTAPLRPSFRAPDRAGLDVTIYDPARTRTA